jgi:hypothetical protein
MTFLVEECLQRPPELLRQILLFDAAKERDGTAVGPQLGETAWAGGEVTLQVGVHVGRELAFQELHEKPHDLTAMSRQGDLVATAVSHQLSALELTADS